jgi:hypothetical protein
MCCRKWDPQPQEIRSVDHHVNARTPRSVTPSVRMEPRADCTRGTPLSARADEGRIPAVANVCAFRPDRLNRRCLLRSLASMRFSRGPGGPGDPQRSPHTIRAARIPFAIRRSCRRFVIGRYGMVPCHARDFAGIVLHVTHIPGAAGSATGRRARCGWGNLTRVRHARPTCACEVNCTATVQHLHADRSTAARQR